MAESFMKCCSKCKVEKPLDAFNRNKKYKDGRRPECRECQRKLDEIARRAKGGKPKYRISADGTMQQCWVCGEWKPLDEIHFPPRYDGKLKFKGTCRQCNNKRILERDRLNEVKPAKSTRKDGLKQCGRCKEWLPETDEYFGMDRKRAGGYAYNCRNCSKIVNRENSQIYVDKIAEYRANHREEARQRSKDWRQENAERHRSSVKTWIKNNRPTVKHINIRRRSRKSGLPTQWSKDDWQRCLDYWNHTCAVCGRPPGLWHYLAVDHWVALSDPRPDNPGTVPWNIVPLCHNREGAPGGTPACNSSKFNNDPIEWLISRYGKRKAKQILKQIEDYFEWVRNQSRS